MSGPGDELPMMIDKIPTLAWSCRPDGTTEFLNQRWLDYTGLSMEASLDWGWKVAIHPDDLEKLMNTWLRLLASGEPGDEEARLRGSDGQYRWFLFRAVPIRDEQGKVVRWYGTNTDIEDLKRAEGELRRIVDLIPQIIFVIRPDGVPLYANRVAHDYTGISPEELPGTGFGSRLSHPEDVERLRTIRQEFLSRGLPFELEGRMLGKDGGYRWFLLRYNALRDEQGHVVRWYVTATDIHDRKHAEEKIQNENLALREEIDRSSMFEEIVGSSAALRGVLAQVTKVAPTDSTVLILGETGTGKELIARAIHKRSGRATRAFIRVNCAAIPASLIASELFGHEKGAFTGALQRRLGRFEAADGGTIFLDEIGDLPAEAQVALLRVLQEREIERVGSSHPIAVDVRVIVATNQDLEAAVARGAFRADLFYRLNVFPITAPPLRERVDDVPVLVEYLVDRFSKSAVKKITRIENRTMALLQAYDWPGNVRELQNVIERAVVLSEGETFSIDDSWLKAKAPPAGGEQERATIEAALVATKGRVAGPKGAAAKLGMPRQTLDSKIRALRIDKLKFRPR